MAPLRNQTTKTVGRLIIGGLVVAGVAAGGYRIADFNATGGGESPKTFIAQDFINVQCSATGGNVKISLNGVGLSGTGAKYNTCIVANPLANISGLTTANAGTGVIKRISLEMGNNPAAVPLDCGFVKSTRAGTGTEIFNNKVVGTGGLALVSTGSWLWNGADYIKCGTLTNPTASFTARLRIEYGDLYGE